LIIYLLGSIVGLMFLNLHEKHAELRERGGFRQNENVKGKNA
jgi:hypothetical protein